MRSRAASCTALALSAVLSALPAAVSAQDPAAELIGKTQRIVGLEFDRVIVVGDLEVEIRQETETELQVRGDAESLDERLFYVRDNTLVLGARAGELRIRKGEQPTRMRVAMPALQELRLKGAGEVYLQPFQFRENSAGSWPLIALEGSGRISAFALMGTALEMRVKGSGNVRVEQIEVDDLEIVIAGGGNAFVQTLNALDGEFVVTGSGDLEVTRASHVTQLEVSVVGSGDAQLTPLDSMRAEINVVGSGSVAVGQIFEQLNASVLGSGDISYAGDPQVERVELGSGEVRRRD